MVLLEGLVVVVLIESLFQEQVDLEPLDKVLRVAIVSLLTKLAGVVVLEAQLPTEPQEQTTLVALV
jgi:hypothetical protein